MEKTVIKRLLDGLNKDKEAEQKKREEILCKLMEIDANITEIENAEALLKSGEQTGAGVKALIPGEGTVSEKKNEKKKNIDNGGPRRIPPITYSSSNSG